MNDQVILCVDDEQFVLNTLKEQLEHKFKDQYELEFAESAEEALELMEELIKEGYAIVLIITDQIMPGMSGDELLVNVHTHHPKSIKILLTGQAALESAVNAINHADLYRYLIKPWEEDDLLLTVEKGLQQYHLMDTMEKQIHTFEKFVPRQFLRRIAREGYENIQLGDAESDQITILFSDIRSFTPLSETMSPQQLLNFLNSYLKVVNQPIHTHGGFIDKFIGDAIMALFDDTTSQDSVEALSAIEAAIGMQEALKEYNQNRQKVGYPPIEIGIGIHSGQVIIGTVGSETRMESTVLGDVVNVAARLETLTKLYKVKIMISLDTLKLLEDPHLFHIRQLDIVRVKGKKMPTEIYEVFNCDPPAIQDLKIQTASLIKAGLHHRNHQEWKPALTAFEKALGLYPEDTVVQRQIAYCRYFQENPPQMDWGGIIDLETDPLMKVVIGPLSPAD